MRYHVPVAAALLVIATSGGVMRGDDYRFDLAEFGTIDTDRLPPDIKVVRNPKKLVGTTVIQTEEVFAKFGGDCQIKLGEIVTWNHPALEREVSSGVIVDSVRTGWLAGANDLLIIAWTENQGEFGTAHSVYRGTLIVRRNETEAVPLIRGRSLSSASSQHIHFPGLEKRQYRYDVELVILEERITQTITLASESPRLLHVAIGEVACCAHIQQQAIRRFKYRAGKLTEQSVQLFYRAQGRESLQDISKFYLGPFASAQAILKINPELKDQANAGIAPAKGTLIQIPVPEDWLSRFYSSVDASH